jgi:4-hydroxy-tetrahydrodipicolinate synthase
VSTPARPDSPARSSFARRLDRALLPAVPITLRPGGSHDQEAAERYAAYIARAPVAGVAVWAHTGRGLLIDEETAVEVLRGWRSALPGRLVIAGAGCRDGSSLPPGERGDRDFVARARRMAAVAAENGADAVLVFPPARFRSMEPAERRRAIAEYHREVAAEGLPAIAFHLYERAGGVSYTLDELRAIFEVPGIDSVKLATMDSVMTYQDVSSFLERELPGKAILTGEDRFLGYSLLRGAAGALIGMGAICPTFQKSLVDAALDARSGDEKSAARFLALSAKADRLAECLFIEPMDGYIGRLLHGLAFLGVIPPSAARDPWSPPFTPGELRAIEETLAGLGEA